jgi:acetyl-CoA synthetase
MFTVAGAAPSADPLVNAAAAAAAPAESSQPFLQAPGLPKTRSGKIMRRVLRKIAADQLDELGDTSTLAEPQVVDQLIASRPKTLAKL